MKKTLCILLAAMLLVGLFTGCAAETPAPVGQRTVVDHAGNTVTLPDTIDRIAVLDIFPLPSVLAVFFGSAEKIVVMAPASMSAAKNGLLSELYPEILNADTSPVSGSDVNLEELMKHDPQTVFYSADNPTLGENLRKAGFAAVAISAEKWDYDAIKTLNGWLDLLSQIFPADTKKAETVREYGEYALGLVQERTASLTDAERQRLFFLFQYSEDSIVTSGSRFFGQWWADTVGAINVAAEMEKDKGVKVTQEQVYVWNPSMILMTNYNTFFPDDLYNDTVGSYDWSGIDAVQNRQVFKMPLGMYRSYTPGADTPITLLWMAKTVYPERFADIDITAKTVEYYKAAFGITLTDAQAERIFAPSGAAGSDLYLTW